VPGQGQYTWDGEKWTSGTVNTVGAVRYDTPQNLTEAQDAQARQNIYAAPFDALAYSGMQINGGIEVSQELGTTGRSTNGYVCDGWKMQFAGTMAVSAGMSPNNAGFVLPNYIYAAVTTAQPSLGAGDFSVLMQLIEGYRIARLNWGTANAQPITIGFWSNHTPAGVYSGTIRNAANNRSYAFTYTHGTVTVPQYNVVTIPGDTAGTWAADNSLGIVVTFAQACGATNVAPAGNVWAAAAYLAAPGQVNGAAAINNALRITGVVVLPGVEAPTAERSPLIMRPYDQELVTCQRYWTRVNAGLQGYAAAGGVNFGAVSPFPVEMRVSPTIFVEANVFPAINISAYAILASTNKSFLHYGTSTAAGGLAYYTISTANARL
jgi:hypothetical protein